MTTKQERTVTVFSKGGQLLQVEYAKKAAQGGALTVGVRGADIIVFGVEKRSIETLQTPRTVRKVSVLDDHICMVFSGVTADGRIIMNRARIECRSYKLTLEDAAPVEYIARFIASLKQKCTQQHGVRPFGISTILAGFDDHGKPHLYLIEPSGEYCEWRATAIGQNSKNIITFLEYHLNQLELLSEDLTIRLAIRALLEVIPPDSDDMEITLMKRGQPLMMLSKQNLDDYIQEVEEEKKEEEDELQEGLQVT